MPPHQHTHEQQMRPPARLLTPWHPARTGHHSPALPCGQGAARGSAHWTTRPARPGAQPGPAGWHHCNPGRRRVSAGPRAGRTRAKTREAKACGYPACGRVWLPGVREDAVTRRAGGCGYPAREGAVTRRARGCGYPARGRVRLPGVREDVVTRRAGGCGYPGVREGVVTPGVREGREGRGQPTRTIPSAHPARCYRPGRCRPPAWHPRCRRSLCH